MIFMYTMRILSVMKSSFLSVVLGVFYWLVAPVALYAQPVNSQPTNPNLCNLPSKPSLTDYLEFPVCLINKYIIRLLLAIAVVMFFIGVIRYVMDPSSKVKREQAAQYVTWGLIGIFVIVAMWGIIYFMASTVQVGIGGNVKSIPQFTK